MAGVLEGLKVVEVAGVGPGPFCGMVLADLGADVITVERPAPDAGRPRPTEIFHRGKRSIMLDLKQPGAAEVVLRLVEDSDALIEGMRPGKMERLGLGPEVCLARRPSLVYGRMTGWGQDGPLASVPGHDSNFTALSGALWLSSPPGQRPEAAPTLLGDVCGGALYLALGILAGVLRARTDGRGQVVDAAMVDGSAHMLNLVLAISADRDWPFDRAKPAGDPRHWVRSYRCADNEWIYVDPDEPQFYADLIKRLGLDHDPRFTNGQDNPDTWPALAGELEDLFATKTRAEWCELLEGTDACFAPVLSPPEAANHPHMVKRDVYTTIDNVLQAAPAPRFTTTPSPPPTRVPPRGAHTHDILTQLNLTPQPTTQLAGPTPPKPTSQNPTPNVNHKERVSMVEGPLCVGFLGVGTISAAIVDSILSAPNAEQVDILLSPRSTSRSAELAARHERVRIAAHNQAVVDASDIVVIAVLPAQVADLCAALTFRADQVIVSVAAGWPPSLLSERVEPASTVCQMIPLPMIGVHAGPLVLYPRVVAIEQLLEGCGEIVTPDREEDIIVLNCVSSTMSTFFKFQETLIDWSVQQGLDPEIARDYVVAYFHGLTTESTKSKVIDMSEMVKEHETPRGLNEYLRRSLSEAGTFAELGRHLDHLHKTRDHAKLRKRGDGANA